MNFAPNPAWEETERRRYVFAVATRASLAFAALATCLTLCACSDDNAADVPAAPHTQEADNTPHLIEWLRLSDGVAPEQWLASREAHSDLGVYDPAVTDMRRVLDVAASRFRDHPRMIANRAVQLETMLKEKSIDERAPRLIVTLGRCRCRRDMWKASPA